MHERATQDALKGLSDEERKSAQVTFVRPGEVLQILIQIRDHKEPCLVLLRQVAIEEVELFSGGKEHVRMVSEILG